MSTHQQLFQQTHKVPSQIFTEMHEKSKAIVSLDYTSVINNDIKDIKCMIQLGMIGDWGLELSQI